MTVSDARTNILDVLNRVRNAYHKDAEVLRALETANRLFHRAICAVDSRHFAQYTRITYPANTESIDLTGASYLNGTFREILGVDELQSNAALSSTNLCTQIPLIHPSDLARRYVTSQEQSSGVILAGTKLYAAIQQNSLYLAVPPTEAKTLRIQWIAANPTTLTGDSSNLLDGKALSFHDAVWLLAAKLLSLREQRHAPELSEIIAQVRAELGHTEESRGGHESIGYVDPY